ncbi:MAG: tellurite resistance TerB family protein [Methanobacteriota archaeon]
MRPMGIFDKVLGSGSEKLNAREGFCGIALCAISADGVITEEEAFGLTNALARMRLYQGISEREFRGMFAKLVSTARAKGVEPLLSEAAAAVPPELRPTAFAVATDLLMADGHVAPDEKRFLEKIQKSLDVPDDLAVKIADVIRIKNQG